MCKTYLVIIEVGMVRDKVRELAVFMENYEFLRKKKEMIRDEVYQLVETIGSW
jgi:hypothetical protein